MWLARSQRCFPKMTRNAARRDSVAAGSINRSPPLITVGSERMQRSRLWRFSLPHERVSGISGGCGRNVKNVVHQSIPGRYSLFHAVMRKLSGSRAHRTPPGTSPGMGLR
jgi:hypothetical protein